MRNVLERKAEISKCAVEGLVRRCISVGLCTMFGRRKNAIRCMKCSICQYKEDASESGMYSIKLRFHYVSHNSG
jgi:hypothetical protein